VKPSNSFNHGSPAGDRLALNKRFAQAIIGLRLLFAAPPPADTGERQNILAQRLNEFPDERQVLVEGVTRALADPSYLQLLLDLLERLRKQGEPLLPCEEVIPDERVDRLLRRGPEALDNGELGWLALSPEQLSAFSEEIEEKLTHFWINAVDDAMAQAARELGHPRRSTADLAEEIRACTGSTGSWPSLRAQVSDETGDSDSEQPDEESLEERTLVESLRGGAVVKSEGADCVVLSFADEEAQRLGRRIAEHLYGDPDRPFTLSLHQVSVAGHPEQIRAELEITPAPRDNPLTFAITFPSGDRRVFSLVVPEQPTDSEEEPRSKTRSLPCEPLARAAFDFKGDGTWRDETWPPELVLGSF
jgi:hypothetical protein